MSTLSNVSQPESEDTLRTQMLTFRPDALTSGVNQRSIFDLPKENIERMEKQPSSVGLGLTQGGLPFCE